MSVADHPVLIPTSEGPVGGIVSAPDGAPRARMVLIPGYGRPARSGVNGFWTRLARSLAELGIVVLRADLSREGETLPIGEGISGLPRRRDCDFMLFEQILPWFAERAEVTPLLFAGACGGSRFSIEFAGREPEAVGGIFLIAPDMRYIPESDAEDALQEEPEFDPLAMERLRATLGHAPVWVLTGERDFVDAPALKRKLGHTAHELEFELLPAVAFHFLDQPDIQQRATNGLIARCARLLAERETVPAHPAP